LTYNIGTYQIVNKDTLDSKILQKKADSINTKYSLIIKKCSILNLDTLKDNENIIDLIISNCPNIRSLNGILKSIKTIRIIDCHNLPVIILDHIVHIRLHGLEEDYHLSLLKFVINSKRLNEINDIDWPLDFEKDIPELKRSLGGIKKFNI